MVSVSTAFLNAMVFRAPRVAYTMAPYGAMVTVSATGLFNAIPVVGVRVNVTKPHAE